MKLSVTRLLQVTSIDKVYHEDNVYGIKCGDVKFETTTAIPKIDDRMQNSSLSKIVLIWCAVLSILIIAMCATIFIYRNRKYNMSRLHLRHSIEINGSECPNDLLNVFENQNRFDGNIVDVFSPSDSTGVGLLGVNFDVIKSESKLRTSKLGPVVENLITAAV
ncbi:hypothetical protein RR46_06360 [Papilio xuthus]|uniref:Uncharacterized protein n=1 Tax=Papilio xuthus TaxID=66420 RepID=A0A194QCQ8_PAPXU|nr:hypothetical protein RR46_06360 [Papilio xuthus]